MLIEKKAYNMLHCNLHLCRECQENVLNTILNILLLILLFPSLTYIRKLSITYISERTGTT